MRNLLNALSIFFLITGSSLAAQAEPRTVFVQLFEWPWQDIARECEDVLGPNGFSAVQVSPPQEHLVWKDSPWWVRYQPISYKLDSRSGTPAEFKDMVTRCAAAGVDIYVDAVFNHMAGIEDGTGFSGTVFHHFEYPGLYSYDDFHHCGRNGNDDIRNFGDLYELQNCELLNLADLKTGSASVQQKIANYLTSLLKLGVRGFRIDAAKHMASADIAGVLGKIKPGILAAPYIYQEVALSGGDPVSYDDYFRNGDVTDYSYPYELNDAFKNGHFGILPQISLGPIQSSDAIVFATNHDVERAHGNQTLTLKGNPELYRLAQVFMYAWPYGYPQAYSGYDFKNFDDGPPLDAQSRTLPILDAQGNCAAPWTCEHRLPEVLNMVQFRNRTNAQFFVSNYWSNGTNQVAFARGDLGFVVINASTVSMKENLNHGLPAGRYCNLLDPSYNRSTQTCRNPISLTRSGRGQFAIKPMSALVLMRSP